MNTRIILPALLGAVIFSSPLLAAGSNDESPARRSSERLAAMTPANQCSTLEKQFDTAIKTHGKATKVDEAKAMRTEGGKLCASGKQVEGVAKLKQAMKELGVKIES